MSFTLKRHNDEVSPTPILNGKAVNVKVSRGGVLATFRGALAFFSRKSAKIWALIAHRTSKVRSY